MFTSIPRIISKTWSTTTVSTKNTNTRTDRLANRHEDSPIKKLSVILEFGDIIVDLSNLKLDEVDSSAKGEQETWQRSRAIWADLEERIGEFLDELNGDILKHAKINNNATADLVHCSSLVARTESMIGGVGTPMQPSSLPTTGLAETIVTLADTTDVGSIHPKDSVSLLEAPPSERKRRHHRSKPKGTTSSRRSRLTRIIE
jgi:hypothetical protein